MEALMLTAFVSLILAGGGVWLFAWLVEERTLDHADRLALLPLENEQRDDHARRLIPLRQTGNPQRPTPLRDESTAREGTSEAPMKRMEQR